MSKRDYYDVLSVKKNASSGDIKKSYRKLAMKYHPDKNQGDTVCESKFKDVTEAYEILSDPEKRRQYDTFGHDTQRQGGRGFDPFSDIFGGFGQQQQSRPRQNHRGRDVEYTVSLTLQQSVYGDDLEIKIPKEYRCTPCRGSGILSPKDEIDCRSCGGNGMLYHSNLFGQRVASECGYCSGRGKVIIKPCKVCNGEGYTKKQENFKLTIPSGITSGERLRYQGRGFTNKDNGVVGDLYISVKILPHDIYQRDAFNLIRKLEVGYSTLCLGGEVQLTLLDNTTLKVRISRGSVVGKLLRITGKGIRRGNGRVGDLICSIDLQIPKNINSKHEKILRSLSKF